MKDKKYPYLVEQMYYHLMTQGSVVSKQFVFDYLKKERLLDKFGNPTPKAIKSGVLREDSSPISAFKAKYPELVDIPNSGFNVDDSRNVSVKPKAKKKFLQKLKETGKQLDKK